MDQSTVGTPQLHATSAIGAHSSSSRAPSPFWRFVWSHRWRQGRPSLSSPPQVEAIRSWTEANVSIDTCLYVELYKRPTKVAPVLQSCQTDLQASIRDEKVLAPAYDQDDSLRLLQRSYVERKGLPFPLLWLLLMWSPLLPRAARVPGHGSGNAGRLRSLLGSLVFATIARSFDKILTEALSLESGGGGYVYFSLYSKSLGYEDWWMVGAQLQILLNLIRFPPPYPLGEIKRREGTHLACGVELATDQFVSRCGRSLLARPWHTGRCTRAAAPKAPGGGAREGNM